MSAPAAALPIMQGPPGAETLIDGQHYLYFGGTSYLGLAGRPEVIEAACEAARQFGIHTATSRSGFGTNPLTLAVERLAAEFFDMAGAFYFASGYVAGHILIQAVAPRCDVVLADESAHYSLIEAAHLLGKPVTRFHHRDPEDLEQKLQRRLRRRTAGGRRPLLLSDGVFSLTGAVAPLDQYLRVLGDCDAATILIDDAHGFGTLGRHGRGTLEHLGLLGPAVNAEIGPAGVAIFVCGTLSKALGGFGGILPGSLGMLEQARRASHYYEGASAPPAPAAGASARALEIVLAEPQLRERLRGNVARLRAGLGGLGLAVEDSPAPIVGLSVGDAANMRRIHLSLRSAGIIVPYFAAYSGTGKEGTLRIAVFATHSEEMIDRLLAELGRVL